MDVAVVIRSCTISSPYGKEVPSSLLAVGLSVSQYKQMSMQRTVKLVSQGAVVSQPKQKCL